MAYWAECVRRHWWCVNGFDWISWFSKFHYDNWWNSLTDEQRERIIARRKAKKEKDRKDAITALVSMGVAMACIYDKSPDSAIYHSLARELKI